MTLCRRTFVLFLLICLGCSAQSVPPDVTRRIERQVRSFYSLPSEVQITVGPLKPSEFPGYDVVAVENEIASLPDSYRSVLMLREVEGLSTAETAEILGVNDDVIKQRLHRARTMLRDNLYKRAGLTFDGVFTFGQSRCDRMVAGVMARITTL